MSARGWVVADPIGDLDVMLAVNLDNVARLVGRLAEPAGDRWVLEAGYLSGGSDVIFIGTRAEVEEARDALLMARGADYRSVINLADVIRRRRR